MLQKNNKINNTNPENHNITLINKKQDSILELL